MPTMIPMMVIGHTPMGRKQAKVVEVSMTADQYSKGEHYQEALAAAFLQEGLMGPMMALAPEDAAMLTDGLGTLKQCLMGSESVVGIHSRGQSTTSNKIAKIS